MQPIVVAQDGSENDARAVAVGASVAKLADTDLHFVRVVTTDVGAVKASHYMVPTELANAAASLAAAAGKPPANAHRATAVVLDARNVADELIRHAVDRDALLVVMATRARGSAERAVLGSVADRVARECPRPVIVVPPGAGFLSGKAMTIARVLVPLDGSTLSLRALEFLIELPHASDLEYVLMQVVPDQRARVPAAARLETHAAWLRSRGVRAVSALAVVGPDPAVRIVEAIREALPEIIVMSTRGESGLNRLLFGSVAEGVIRRSELPVFLLTPGMLAERFKRS